MKIISNAKRVVSFFGGVLALMFTTPFFGGGNVWAWIFFFEFIVVFDYLMLFLAVLLFLAAFFGKIPGSKAS